MCGIVGYIGKKNTKEILISGLKELEYRGYDSAGIAILQNDNFLNFKSVGKIINLQEKTKEVLINGFSIGIGHTRWATHGKPTEINAHPHLGENSYVVHNGIIENYSKLKKDLIKEGVRFLSQTDTEVIVHLFEKYKKEEINSFEAFKKTIKELNGTFAILLITKDEKETIFYAKNGSPLIIGKNGEDEFYFASSDTPLIGNCTNVHYLEDGNFGYVNSKEIIIFDENEIKKEVNFSILSQNKLSSQKDGYRYFMEKEIYEQSVVISDTLIGRIGDEEIIFEELDDTVFENIKEIKFCACGTSYNAALSASYLFERYLKIKTSIEIASEFRYRNPILTQDTLFIVVSQSGETADTLETLKMAKAANIKTLAICNVDNSSIVRLADMTILTRAGIEKGVASTKAFSTQVIVLWLFSLYLAKLKNTMEKEEINKHISIIREIPSHIKVKDDLHENIKRLSKRYLHGHGFFFIGRDIFYPLALEGALKLKEISYLHAEGYPAGEMKHGPIALADPELFTIALLPKYLHYEKVKSNIEELSARDSTICAISQLRFEKADDFIKIENCNHYMLEFFEMLVVLQLLALEISIRLKNDVDMPRNLAKSVTVE